MTNTNTSGAGRGESATDDRTCMATMHDLADASGKTIMPFFRADIAIDEKHGKGIYDPVTEADRAAERTMRGIVAERHPAHGMIGEEFGSENADADACWIFDPIDGTRAFIIGAPTWGTLIGFNRDGRPRLGLMNQPFTGERFWGGPDGAFFRHNDGPATPLRCSANDALGNAVLSSTAPDYFKREDEWQRFQRLAKASRMTRYGYDCYAYCLLAMGRIDLVAETALASYDIAPLIPIVEAAGGVVTTWTGGDPSQGGAILASANAALHDKALALLS